MTTVGSLSLNDKIRLDRALARRTGSPSVMPAEFRKTVDPEVWIAFDPESGAKIKARVRLGERIKVLCASTPHLAA